MQVIGILYEVADMVELQNLTTYLPQNSKSYYLCRADKKIYEKNFSGQYVVSSDLDEYIHNIKNNNENLPIPNNIETKTTLPNISKQDDDFGEIKKTIDYLSKHIYNINFKVNEVINILNPNILPSDIHTRYNPDEVMNNNVEQHNEHVPEQLK